MTTSYWETRFTSDDGIRHHRGQNNLISTDFLSHARRRKPFADALNQDNIIEIGCGTGELSEQIQTMFNTACLYGTDFSRAAVVAAQKHHPTVNFWVFDILKDPVFGDFQLAIASNVLEHFTFPYVVVDKMLALAPQAIVLIPYRQPVRDGYDEEGGAGHVYEFSKKTFKRYHVADSFLFETKGWQHSSLHERPQQLAVLLNA